MALAETQANLGCNEFYSLLGNKTLTAAQKVALIVQKQREGRISNESTTNDEAPYNNYNYINYKKYNINYNTYNANTSEKKESQEIDRSEIILKIHRDVTYKTALGWGMQATLLYNLIAQYGEARVRESIDFTGSIQDGYFRADRPIEKQRGAYCRAVIINGIKKG